MAHFANVFTSHLPNSDAFSCYANFIMKSELLRSFYSYNLLNIQMFYKIIEYFMQKKAPKFLH